MQRVFKALTLSLFSLITRGTLTLLTMLTMLTERALGTGFKIEIRLPELLKLLSNAADSIRAGSFVPRVLAQGTFKCSRVF